MHENKFRLTAALAAAFACSLSAETVSVRSPDGANEIRVNTEPNLSVEILRNGKRLSGPNAVALTIAGKGTLGIAPKLKDSKDTSCKGNVVATPVYKKASIDEAAQSRRLFFADDWGLDIAARDDGVAYRFFTAMNGRIKVLDETAELAFADASQCVYAALNNGGGEGDPLQCSWEGVYERRTVGAAPTNSAKNIWYAPITFEFDRAAMCVTETDLRDYAGWNYARDARDERKLVGVFARYPGKTRFYDWHMKYTDHPTRYQRVQSREAFIAETDGTRTFPWRVFMLADNVAKLVESDIVYALASPSAIGDASWIRPGKVAWDWWCRWNVIGVDFRAGCNTKTYEYFIDFAQKTGVEYVIFDEGWSKRLQIFEFNPEVDVPHLVKYANERGVGIILWAAWAQFLGREEEVASHYAEMGVKGFKIDFMDRDDQAMVNFLEKMAAVAAKHKLLVDYHGMYKPSGIQRRYPNVLNFEGVHGLENCKWGKTCGEYMPVKDCTLVFTRMLAGPMDYTPGAMRNVLREAWRPTPATPGAPGTRVHQMALMTLFEAPLQMLCDSPSQYLANQECFAFMSKMPTTWDDTRALGGEMDGYAALARRKGDAWYAAAICGWNKKTIAIDTSFLGSGAWKAEIFADGVNADRDATDYAHKTVTVQAGQKIPVKFAPGGGWTARFTRR